MIFLCLLSALVVSVLSSNQVCPGGAFSCPDASTCCQLADKSYGCCPLKNAVCCDDHIHCCPENNKCDAGLCIQLSGGNSTAIKTSPSKAEDIKCFGSEYVCPDNTTCCKGKNPGIYGCCPMKDAVCCSDGFHCCPKDTICDLKAEKCVSIDGVAEMYDSQKHGAYMPDNVEYMLLSKPENVGSIVCPDSSFQCPNDYTCCQLPSGDWGCCPFVNATCCNDRLHCCPENLKCDAASKTCLQGFKSYPASLKKLAKPVNIGITCPDNSTCAESMTCCELKNEQYGCCAYDNAVCCDDHEHCCPNGYVCDSEQKRCVVKGKKHFSIAYKYFKKSG